jgi:nucleoid-associated protein YgaU
VGIGLTALTAAPGLLGSTSSVAVRLVLPAAARRGAAALLGLGLGVAPLLGTVAMLLPETASAAGPITGTATASAAVPDWPSPATPAGVPDWPSPPVSGATPSRSPDTYVVLRGDCLWDIAADRLHRGRQSAPTNGEIAGAVHAWWSVNASVIGPDPDRVLPGQVLAPPVTP